MERKTEEKRNIKPKTPRISEKAFNDALHDSGGLLKYACKLLGITYEEGWRMYNRYPSCRETMRRAREAALDTAEYGLQRHLECEEPWAIQFMLKYQGRERGYVEKQEVESITHLNVSDILAVSDDELKKTLERLKSITNDKK